MKPASAKYFRAPKVGGLLNMVAAPPPKSWAATASRVTPMMVITVPVTIGGKNRMIFAKNGASRNAKIPPTMTAP